jgi:transcriptional regulator with XRE-family HTH domain
MRIDTIAAGVKELRQRVGDTQQQFANRLGLAISSIVRYEAGKNPDTAILLKLWDTAEKADLPAIAEMFRRALLQDVGAVAYREAENVEIALLRARMVLETIPGSADVPAIVKALAYIEEAKSLVSAMNPFTPGGQK